MLLAPKHSALVYTQVALGQIPEVFQLLQGVQKIEVVLFQVQVSGLSRAYEGLGFGVVSAGFRNDTQFLDTDGCLTTIV